MIIQNWWDCRQRQWLDKNPVPDFRSSNYYNAYFIVKLKFILVTLDSDVWNLNKLMPDEQLE